MSTEECLARAAFADRQRRNARDEDERRIYEEIASLWRNLAGEGRAGPEMDRA